jgi:hypothetical protein
MVATGYFDLKSVEVLNLDPAKPDLTCDNLPDLPVGLNGATGQLVQVAILNTQKSVFTNQNWTYRGSRLRDRSKNT